MSKIRDDDVTRVTDNVMAHRFGCSNSFFHDFCKDWQQRSNGVSINKWYIVGKRHLLQALFVK